MAICCNRLVVWTEHPHTSHFLVFLCTQNSVARDIGSRCSPRRVIHVSYAWVVVRSDFPSTLHSALFTVSLIFYFILLIFIFIFHVGRFGENSPVRFREWGVWLFGQQRPSHRLWPQLLWRLPHLRNHWMKSSSRSPPATAGPRTCMTRRSMTTPLAERSLLHCSLRSEKNQRAVDKLVTLLKKVCSQVSRCLSVMQELRDLLMSVVRWVQASEKIQVATQKMSKSGFLWNDKKSKFSLIVEQRLTNTSSKPIMTEEVSKNWSCRVSTRWD